MLNNVPQADAAIRTCLVRDDIPDVMTLNGSGNFARARPADVFYDFADEPVLETVNPAIVKILTDLGTSGEGEVNGVPFANNADGVIYNKDLFAEYGLEMPRTWDELIAVADAFQAEGINPFYITLKDAWTALPAFNALASNLPPEDFLKRVDAGETSFERRLPRRRPADGAAVRLRPGRQVLKNYKDGNQAFATGDVPMCSKGSGRSRRSATSTRSSRSARSPSRWTTPTTPTWCPGVDVALTMPKEPAHPEASLALIEYLMRPEVVGEVRHRPGGHPDAHGQLSEDPALEGLLPYFEDKRLVGFTDHQIPASIPLQQINQSFLIDGNQQDYLSTLDSEWDKFVDRRPEPRTDEGSRPMTASVAGTTDPRILEARRRAKQRRHRVPAMFYWMALPAFGLFFLFTRARAAGLLLQLHRLRRVRNVELGRLQELHQPVQDDRIRDSYVFTLQFAVLTTIVVNVARWPSRPSSTPDQVPHLVPRHLLHAQRDELLIVGYIFNYLFATRCRGSARNSASGGCRRTSSPTRISRGSASLSSSRGSRSRSRSSSTWPDCRRSPQLYEAASLDGASGWLQFRSITFPMLAAFFTINMVLSLKDMLMVFDLIFALTNGGPGTSTESISLVIYRGGFQGGEFAYQMANAMVLFLMIVIFSISNSGFCSGGRFTPDDDS